MTEKETIYSKLAKAKKQIANTEMKKAGKNSFSNYDYFTPEQVAMLVQKACDDNWLITLFSLERNEYWVYWVLTVIDTEDWWEISVRWATAIPEIKATNVAQQIWWCMTYTERYLKMSLFWIIDNNLDFDTTENTKKNSWMKQMTDADYKKLEASKGQFKTADELVKAAKTKYIVDQVLEAKIRSLYD